MKQASFKHQGLHQAFSPRSSQIKVPKIGLPSSSGKYTEWTIFIDKFDFAVLGKLDIRAAEKFKHLKTSFRGDGQECSNN